MDKSAIISKFEPQKDNMLNILHELQNSNPQNFLTTEDLKLVANYLNTTYSSVYGVVKYYSMFSVEPRGKYLIRICKSPLCNMVGDKSVLNDIKENIGIGIGEITDDLMFSVEASECLGHCAEAPVMMINEGVYKNLDSKKIKDIFQNIKLNHKNTD
jgi:NADH:ubiquinone oxidoreductase subunit E